MAFAELDIVPRLNGRAAQPIEAAVVRELTSADLSLLGAERGIKAPVRKRMRDRHHSLARCLAQGMEGWEASAVTGYSPATISILQGDPSFVELVTFYRRNEDAALAEFTQRASLLTLTAVDNLQELAENEADPLTFEQNLAIAKVFADRTGHAPIARSVSVNVNGDLPGRLASAKARLAARVEKALPAPAADPSGELIEGECRIAAGGTSGSGPGP